MVDSNIHVVEALLSSSSSKVNGVDQAHRTALHWAAAAGKDDTVKLLLDHGAKVELQDETGATAVHLSTQSVSRATVEVFLKRGLG